MSETENTMQVIELRQLPIIEERLQSVKAEIEARTAKATSLACTEDTYKDVKKVRTELGKQFEALEKQRKQVKAAIMAPYDSFEKLYKECVSTPFTAADADLKKKINDVEDGLKGQKAAEVREYYNELVAASGLDWLNQIEYHPAVSMSVSVKKLKEQAKALVAGIVADVEMIGTLPQHTEVMVEFRANGLNAAAAIKTVSDRTKAQEEQRQREEEYRRRMEQRAAATQKVKAAVPAEPQAVAPPAEVQADPEAPQEVKTAAPAAEVYLSKFWCKGTIEQLTLLKQFLEGNGMEYGTV